MRKMAEHTYDDKICKGFRRKGIPGKTDSCSAGSCCDWDEFLGDKLGNTIYADMPNSIRPGKVFHRGSRGSKRKAKGANKENSGGVFF